MVQSSPNQVPENTLNNTDQYSEAKNRKDTQSRPQKSSNPRQNTNSSTPQNIDDLRKQIIKLTEIIEQKKAFLNSLGTSLSNAYIEYRKRCEPKIPKAVIEEISALSKRNAILRNKLKANEEKEKKLTSNWRVLNKQNELKALQRELAKVKEEVETLQMLRQRRNEKMREIDSEVSQARSMRDKQREFENESRVQCKSLANDLRQITKEDLKTHNRYIRLQEQLKTGITVNDHESLKKSIEGQEEQIQHLQIEEQKLKRSKEMDRDGKHKIISKEQQECKLLESKIAELQKQLQ
ncbi:unnamed protein product [Phytomonas sp. Hart1]|nr:unnamed protein product [Phytomonas sp. Hart1]|eukprot:CCW68716.1 unnamed protein product [Phytomonas sp. isolate Hart1]